MAVACTSFAAAGNAEPEERVYQLRPSERAERAINHIGVTGIQARIYPGGGVKVEALVDGSPADGKFAEGEILTAVNGVEHSVDYKLPDHLWGTRRISHFMPSTTIRNSSISAMMSRRTSPIGPLAAPTGRPPGTPKFTPVKPCTRTSATAAT